MGTASAPTPEILGFAMRASLINAHLQLKPIDSLILKPFQGKYQQQRIQQLNDVNVEYDGSLASYYWRGYTPFQWYRPIIQGIHRWGCYLLVLLVFT